MTTSPDLPPPMNHVFVDFENVPHVDLLVFGNKISIILLLGAKQTKLDADLVEKLLEHAGNVQIVRLETFGKNALDFTLAYYLGRAVLADPTGSFHIVSKDTGFDPLIKHLRSRNIHALRHDNYTALTFSASAKPVAVPVSVAVSVRTPVRVPPDDLLSRVLAHLRKNTTNRPKRQKTLVSHLLALAGKTATEADISTLIQKLIKAKYLSLSDKDAVAYHL